MDRDCIRPRRSDPRIPSSAFTTAVRAAEAASSVLRASGRSARPASVSWTACVVRSNRRVPRSRSRLRTETESADWPRYTRLDARVKLRSSATATKCSSWRSSISNAYPSLQRSLVFVGQHNWEGPSWGNRKKRAAQMTTTKTQPSAQDLQGELDGPAPGIPDVLNDGTRTHDRQWSVGITRHGVAFWVVAVAFLFNMAFSAVPTPLYVLYQQRDHFSQIMVTIVYAVYAVGVIASLFLAGHISDWVGR